MQTSGTLFVVATPIGNLEDITLRALRVLREVALIAAEDTRRTAHLLARHGIATPMTSLHEHNEARKAPSLVDRLRAGDSIAVVSDAGTPTISDPGSRLIDAALAAGIRVEPIPGPSAVMAALAASGMPSETFSFLGFPPTRSNARSNWFTRLRQLRGTVVFFEAPHRIERTLADLMEAVGDCEILIGRELTKTHETLVKCQISRVLSAGIRAQGEFTVVANIGHTTEMTHREPPSAAALFHEFCDMTKKNSVERRTAIRQLAKRHGLTPNIVYRAIETGRKSVD